MTAVKGVLVISAFLKLALVVAALLAVWWVVASIGPSDAEAVAVAKAEAQRWKEQAQRDSAEVARLKPELAAAREEAGRIDTIVRVVLRNPPPVRPQTPTGPALDSLPRDSLLAVLGRSEAYGDTVTRENVTLRAVLDTTIRGFTRYRSVADSTIAAQARQIVALNQQITALNVIIDVRECRILGFLKCPSRKVSAIGGVLLGAAAVGYVRR